MPSSSPMPPGTRPDIGQSMQAASLIWQSISEVAAAALIGWGLDWFFDTDKVFLLIGALVGIAVGITSFVRSALKESRRLSSQQRSSTTRKP
ncbi:MAG: hypothetical protein CMJ40_07550 [Phycisphaerae bacterium]|nr:hypothetical protein [Phycisphaerae bacterium]